MKKKKRYWKLLFAAAVLIMAYVLFKDSFSAVGEEIRGTSWQVVLVICLCAGGCQLSEGGIFTYLGRKYNAGFRYREGVSCSLYTAFYRTITLGGGTAAACVYYLYKEKGIDASKGIALSTLQYVMHKAGIAVFAGAGFLVCSSFMDSYFGNYKKALAGGYFLTALVCVVLILACISAGFHRFLLNAARKLDKKGRFGKRIESADEQLTLLRNEAGYLFQEKRSVLVVLGLELLKFAFCYTIPFFILYPDGPGIMESACVTALAFTLAGVIPAPGGLGSTEGVLVLLYSQITGGVAAASVMLLYRFATYMLPCIAGGVCAIIIPKSWSAKG